MLYDRFKQRVTKDSTSLSFRSFLLLSVSLICLIATVVHLLDFFTTRNSHEDVVLMGLPNYPYKLTSVACPNMQPFKILCACIVGSADHLVLNLIANMILLQDKCDWAIVSYDNELSTVLKDKLQDVVERGVKIIMAADGKKGIGTPKVLFWPLFETLLDNYDFIWLLDEDLSFHDFDFDSFAAAIGLSFPNGPPLISQPVMWTAGPDGVTPLDLGLDEKHRNKKIKDPWYWIRKGKEIAAAQVAYIEIQMPLIDANFFVYFMEEIFLPSVARTTGSNWGPGLFWCAFAARYAMDHRNGKPARPACAVVPITPLLHLDFQTLEKKEFVWERRGNAAVTEYKRKYKNMQWQYRNERSLEVRFKDITPETVLQACEKRNDQ